MAAEGGRPLRVTSAVTAGVARGQIGPRQPRSGVSGWPAFWGARCMSRRVRGLAVCRPSAGARRLPEPWITSEHIRQLGSLLPMRKALIDERTHCSAYGVRSFTSFAAGLMSEMRLTFAPA